MTGRLSSAGGDGPGTGGAAGAVALQATQGIVVTGAVDASGGNASGAGSVTGGAAGNLTLQADADRRCRRHRPPARRRGLQLRARSRRKAAPPPR